MRPPRSSVVEVDESCDKDDEDAKEVDCNSLPCEKGVPLLLSEDEYLEWIEGDGACVMENIRRGWCETASDLGSETT